MQSDSAYLAQYPPMLHLLQEASGGSLAHIPQSYLDNFYHEYTTGEVSLLPAAGKLENIDLMEQWEVDEVLEVLSRVNPLEWPDPEDIVGIDTEGLLAIEEPEQFCNYVEDNLGTSGKVEEVLRIVLEEVFGKGISSIRDNAGNYPSPKNHFLQEQDGTFAGTFKFENHAFKFEIAPTEVGWLCTYRMTEKCLDKLEKPRYKNQRKNKEKDYRSVRAKAWR